ncbi:MAG: shikimate dehydrogenase family protein [Candidatus Tyrphobacter sp.]
MRLALIGDPVAHSRSPAIAARLLEEAGVAGGYEAIRVRAGDVATTLARLRTQDYDGCNVTSPLKEEAFAVCESLRPCAQKIRAVNTVRFGERTVGTNTDGIGAAGALREVLGALRGREVLVLGSGPTARAAITALGDEGVRLWLWARSEEKMRRICAEFGALAYARGTQIADAAFCALPPNADLPERIREALRAVPTVMDANYGPRATLEAALSRSVVDGSRMLELQARASLHFWLEKEVRS